MITAREAFKQREEISERGKKVSVGGQREMTRENEYRGGNALVRDNGKVVSRPLVLICCRKSQGKLTQPEGGVIVPVPVQNLVPQPSTGRP